MITTSREVLNVVAGGLTAACVIPYLVDVRRGTTHPHRASWFVFAALASLAAAVQIAAGAGAGAWLAAGSAVGFTAVFVASIRRGTGGWQRADRRALGVAAVGGAAWLLSARPLLGLLGVVVAEGAAISLTARKALADPDSETLATWVVDGVAGVIAIGATANASLLTLLYPVHHAAVNGLVVAAITVGRARRTTLLPPDEAPCSI